MPDILCDPERFAHLDEDAEWPAPREVDIAVGDRVRFACQDWLVIADGYRLVGLSPDVLGEHATASYSCTGDGWVYNSRDNYDAPIKTGTFTVEDSGGAVRGASATPPGVLSGGDSRTLAQLLHERVKHHQLGALQLYIVASKSGRNDRAEITGGFMGSPTGLRTTLHHTLEEVLDAFSNYVDRKSHPGRAFTYSSDKT